MASNYVFLSYNLESCKLTFIFLSRKYWQLMEQQRSVHMRHMVFSPITLGRNFSLIMEVNMLNYLYDIRLPACL